MSALSIVDFLLLAAATLLALVAGWMLRGLRSRREKLAVNENWRQQLEALQTEDDRLQVQNTGLMQQINQYQASISDARKRAQDLASTLRETTDKRDELQRELKALRIEFERKTSRQATLKKALDAGESQQQALTAALQERGDKITRLRGEVANWHSRVQPLVERYRTRNLEAQDLEARLADAKAQLAEAAARYKSDETRIEPIDGMPGSMQASNDQYPEISHGDMSAFEDQPATPPGLEVGVDACMDTENLVAGSRDSLQKIRGVGPAIEKVLNDLGYFRYAQIASLTEHDVSRIAEKLSGFSSRIHRDDWIGQARLLDFEKSDRPQ